MIDFISKARAFFFFFLMNVKVGRSQGFICNVNKYEHTLTSSASYDFDVCVSLFVCVSVVFF